MNRCTYPGRLRLKTNADFQAVFRNARKFSGNCFTLWVQRNSFSLPRLGISIAKRNIRQAVARNRIKRVVRESFRLKQQQLDGLDIVVNAHKGADQLDNNQIRERIETQWQKLIAYYHLA